MVEGSIRNGCSSLFPITTSHSISLVVLACSKVALAAAQGAKVGIPIGRRLNSRDVTTKSTRNRNGSLLIISWSNLGIERRSSDGKRVAPAPTRQSVQTAESSSGRSELCPSQNKPRVQAASGVTTGLECVPFRTQVEQKKRPNLFCPRERSCLQSSLCPKELFPPQANPCPREQSCPTRPSRHLDRCWSKVA
jgi:hypothetical protein